MRDRVIQACCVLTYVWMAAMYALPLVSFSPHPAKTMLAVMLVGAIVGAVVGAIKESEWRHE
jgi:hypothetical protein